MFIFPICIQITLIVLRVFFYGWLLLVRIWIWSIKTNTTWYHLYVKLKNKNQTYRNRVEKWLQGLPERRTEVSHSVMPNSATHMDSSPPDSSVHRILQERILDWVAIPFSRGSSWPRDQNWSPALEADSLWSEPQASQGLEGGGNRERLVSESLSVMSDTLRP